MTSTDQTQAALLPIQADYQLAAEILGYKDANQLKQLIGPSGRRQHKELAVRLAKHRLAHQQKELRGEYAPTHKNQP